MRHSRHEEDIDSFTRRCACIIPHPVVGLLNRDFLFVELPVFIDGDGFRGFRAVNDGLNMWDVGFPRGDVATDILASVYEIMFVLRTGQLHW